MIELYSLMWIIAAFTGILGFLRGWNREIVVTGGIILILFVLFQLDSLLRGTILAGIARDQVFFIQAAIFLLVVYYTYQYSGNRRARAGLQSGLIGGLVGFLNGYLIAGSLWYFLDINEYPLNPLIAAPGPGSPSAQYLGTMPILVLSGGVGGSGDFLAVIVIALFVLVVVSL